MAKSFVVQSFEEELTALKAQVAEREESLAAREKLMSDKELTLKKALATVKKLKMQLLEANKQVRLKSHSYIL
jgi:hypothetical protein